MSEGELELQPPVVDPCVCLWAMGSHAFSVSSARSIDLRPSVILPVLRAFMLVQYKLLPYLALNIHFFSLICFLHRLEYCESI